ncbi:MAG: hypothetical protein H0V54_09575 [Chthoniobacterales bacterium]|nr:hypothetical protein [Chthoniobacterales bacterium]
MKTKLTLTVDRDVVADAKKFAKRNGISLSEMVEGQFRKLKEPSFAQKWYGKFEIPVPKPGDGRLKHLLEKYVHDH